MTVIIIHIDWYRYLFVHIAQSYYTASFTCESAPDWKQTTAALQTHWAQTNTMAPFDQSNIKRLKNIQTEAIWNISAFTPPTLGPFTSITDTALSCSINKSVVVTELEWWHTICSVRCCYCLLWMGWGFPGCGRTLSDMCWFFFLCFFFRSNS